MIRLGLCCQFVHEPIKFRTTTAKYASTLKNPLTFFDSLVLHNAQSLRKALTYCQKHHIGGFRITSRFMPLATHPSFAYSIYTLPNSEKIIEMLTECRKTTQIHLTFHPDQFVLLSSPKADVIQRSIADLEYHAELAEILDADVINIHGGGGYGNKKEALKRFTTHFTYLSERIRKRLTVENDDRTYTPSDLLPLCQEHHIPLVYDVHHHRCLPDDLSIEQASHVCLDTWNRPPVFHVSSPLSQKKFRNHHDYVKASDVPECWKSIDDLTTEVEAKAKEQAVLKLQKELKHLGWALL